MPRTAYELHDFCTPCLGTSPAHTNSLLPKHRTINPPTSCPLWLLCCRNLCAGVAKLPRVSLCSPPNLPPLTPPLRISYALVQATVGVGTVIILYVIQLRTKCSVATDDMDLSLYLPISAHVAPGIFCLSLMHPIGPEWPHSAHVACARVCRQLHVLRPSHALVQATVGAGTVIIVYIGVAYTRGGGGGGRTGPSFCGKWGRRVLGRGR